MWVSQELSGLVSEEKVTYKCYASKKIWLGGHRQATPVSSLQCYRSVKKLCPPIKYTVVYAKERAQFEAEDEKLLAKYVRTYMYCL